MRAAARVIEEKFAALGALPKQFVFFNFSQKRQLNDNSAP